MMAHPHSDAVPRIRVLAAVIERQGRYLITQRSSAAVLAGLWEFPNCKVEMAARASQGQRPS